MHDLFDVARHFISKDTPPPALGKIDYITAGNGIYKRAVSDTMMACVPLASLPNGTIPGLPDLVPSMIARHRKIPAALLFRAIHCARLACEPITSEAMYHVRYRDGEFYLSSPIQDRDAGHVTYRIGGTDPIIMDIHSHHHMRASFSGTDDRDEVGLQLYGVLGNIREQRPQIKTRVGVYGTFYPIHTSNVFDFSPLADPFVSTFLEDVSWT